MLRFLLVFVIIIHGLIHLMGFAKAFHYGTFSQLTKEITKPQGILWLTTATLFLISALWVALKKEEWWMTGIAAVVLSQYLVFTVWSDARFGTIANVIVLLVAVLAYGSWHFENKYEKDVAEANTQVVNGQARLLTEQDLQPLPLPVQRYLRYVGVVNKPLVHHYRLVFNGQMRDKGKDWFPFTSEQHNFTDKPTRLFYMKAKMFGVTVPGYHAYKNGDASMQVKLFGLIPVVDSKEDILDKAETVTLFNDMCLLAPATLIDPRIQWEAVDNNTARARFTVNDQTISATLYFNDKGQLVNFVSDDRYAISDKKQYRFSTPIRNYRNYQGYNLPEYGEAVWHYPEGEFAYGKFHLKEVEYK